MFVIADTTPLNYLVRLGLGELLPQSYGDVYIPLAVLSELSHAGTPAEVRTWVESPPAWLRIVTMRKLDETLNPELGLGEREAISLALELRPEALLMDDLEARSGCGSSGV